MKYSVQYVKYSVGYGSILVVTAPILLIVAVAPGKPSGLAEFNISKLNKYESDRDFIFWRVQSCKIPHLMLQKFEAPKSDSYLLTFPLVS